MLQMVLLLRGCKREKSTAKRPVYELNDTDDSSSVNDKSLNVNDVEDFNYKLAVGITAIIMMTIIMIKLVVLRLSCW